MFDIHTFVGGLSQFLAESSLRLRKIEFTHAGRIKLSRFLDFPFLELSSNFPRTFLELSSNFPRNVFQLVYSYNNTSGRRTRPGVRLAATESAILAASYTL